MAGRQKMVTAGVALACISGSLAASLHSSPRTDPAAANIPRGTLAAASSAPVIPVRPPRPLPSVEEVAGQVKRGEDAVLHRVFRAADGTLQTEQVPVEGRRQATSAARRLLAADGTLGVGKAQRVRPAAVNDPRWLWQWGLHFV